MDNNKGFFEELFSNAGRNIDVGLNKINEAGNKITGSRSNGSSNETQQEPSQAILEYFTSRIGKDVILEQVSGDFSYANILRWAAQFKQGNQLYLVKGYLKKMDCFIICAFFAQDCAPLLDELMPKKCYRFHSIPLDIMDLFSGKEMYVQPFK